MIKSPHEYVNEVQTKINELDIKQWQSNPKMYVLIDIREPSEITKGMLPNATHIARGLLEFQLMNHPALITLSALEQASANILLYCQSGGRSALSTKSLSNMGFNNVHSLKGGYNEWLKLTTS
ncbi:rhodanese-like domain-containing protein [Thalassotalea euphylliae]|nr:rhodanese-like domain-containing protein [Thalassotalea euphylliae]